MVTGSGNVPPFFMGSRGEVMTYEDMADQIGLKSMTKELYIAFMKVRHPEFDRGTAHVLAECFLCGVEDQIPDAESKRILAKLRDSYKKGIANYGKKGR